MLRTILVALLWIVTLSGLAEAQSPNTASGTKEIMATALEISYDASAPNFLQWIAKIRTSPVGQGLTKAVAGYYGVPPEIVDLSTNEFWAKQVQHTDAGNEHKGSLASPSGYGVCEAHRSGEVSITGPSALSVAIVRKRDVPGLDGFAWYAAVPNPGRLGAGGNWARAVWRVTFVKSDPAIWNKYKAKCSPPGYVVPAHYILEDCHGKDCTGPYRLN